MCEITEILELATSTVSSHLSILHEAGLIQQEKDGKWVNYFFNPRIENRKEALVNEIIKILKVCKYAQIDAEKVKKVDRMKIHSQ